MVQGEHHEQDLLLMKLTRLEKEVSKMSSKTYEVKSEF